MIQYLCKRIFAWWGWKITGVNPNDYPKKIYVVLSHTSNWDFPVGILMKGFYIHDVSWIAKDSLFRWPFGYMFRALGGIAVNRTRAKNFVGTMVDLFNSKEVFSTSIAPEGTRKKVGKLKSGYYRIAKGASIPIIYTKFDWKNRIVDFAEPRMPAESWEEELAYCEEHFKDTVGKIPEYSYGYPFEH